MKRSPAGKEYREMKHSPLRRALLAAGMALPFAPLSFPARAAPAASPLASRLAGLEREADGRLGVAFVDAASKRTFQYRGNERFAFCSTFKFILAAAVLRESMRKPGLMGKHVAYAEEDLLSYAPIAKKNLGRGMSVAELCAAALQYSDNTATNLLLRELGGLAPVNRFARVVGDPAFRLDRWEPGLNSALPGDKRDTTTPMAMAASARKIVFGKVLDEQRRNQLIEWIKGNATGAQSIRAGVPADWTVGDKTGSGDYGTTNDVAVLWPPGKGPVILAIYFTQPRKEAESRRDVLASAARLVAGNML
jgi:beta-lactamase class A